MKKLASIMLMFLLILPFYGCSTSVPEMNLHIDASYTAEYEGVELQGLLIYSETGEMYMDVSTPDELSGLNYSWKDGFTLGYRGLNALTEEGYLPQTSFPEIIKNILDDLRFKDYTLEYYDNDTYYADCDNENGKYEVFTDSTGYIEEVKLEDFSLKLYNQHKSARK